MELYTLTAVRDILFIIAETNQKIFSANAVKSFFRV
jgi:hypothetical protein